MESPETINFNLNLKFLIPCSIMIPTYAAYFVILYVIFISKFKAHFGGSFYQLFGVSAIFNLAANIIYNFTIRFPQIPCLIPFVRSWGTRSFFITFLYTGIWYFYNVAHLLNLVISLNRVTVFALKNNYNPFWKRWLLPFILFCIFFPCLLVWHIPFTDVYMKDKNASVEDGFRNFAFGNSQVIPWMNASWNTITLLTITASLSLIFNFYVTVRLIKDKFNLVGKAQKKMSKQDIKLCLYAFLIFGLDMIYCVQQYVRRTSSDEKFINVMIDIQNYVSDFTCILPALFIIVTNKHLRKNISATFFNIKENIVIISSAKPQHHSKKLTNAAAVAPTSALHHSPIPAGTNQN